MQSVCRSAPARPLTPRGRGPVHPGTTCHVRVATARRVAVTPAPRLRARAYCVGAGGSGTTEPAVPVAQSAQSVIGETQGEAEVVAEKLESLEEAAIAGEDEGRRPTDYDRRAHIFEESSRVFRELKHRHDGDGVVQGGGGDDGDVAPAAAAGVKASVCLT